MTQAEQDALAFEEWLERMVTRAKSARPNARSWREFNVAACFLARRPNGTRYRLFPGVNMKPRRDGPTFCAEQGALSSALANGHIHIVGLVVIGKPREEDTTPTLHPCWVCRRSIPLIVGHDIPVVTGYNGHRERFMFSDFLQQDE